jgi:hypothetical protein
MVLLYTMDPNRKVAITAEYRGISNPILFFFSWAAWITSFWIMMGFPWKGHSMQQRDWPFMPYAPSSSHWVWYGFVMMSLVIVTTARCMVAKGHCADASRDWSDTALPSKERCNSLRAATGLGSCSFVLSIVWLIVDSIVMDHYIVGALLALLTYSASWLMFDKENQSSVLATKYFYPLLGASWLMVLTMLARNWRIAASMILAAFRYRETDLVHSLIHDQSNITHQEVRHETGESVYVLEPHEVEKGPGAPEQSVI